MVTELRRGGSLVQRLVAGGYDWLFDRVDALGGADYRRRLVEHAAGEVLEIGAGTCPCTAPPPGWWPWSPAPGDAPEPPSRPGGPGHRRGRRRHGRTPTLPRRRLRHGGGKPGAVHGPRPGRGADRGRSGPASGGILRFYQHVRADDPRLARWQDRLERPWGWLAGGCHPNRDVMAAITAAGFLVVELDRFDFPIMPPLVRPHVLGVAERPYARHEIRRAER